MRGMRIRAIVVLVLLGAGLLGAVRAGEKGVGNGNKVDASIRRLIGEVSPERMSKHLFHLAKDPLPFRKLNLGKTGDENWGQPVRHEGVEDQRMRDPSEEFSVHLARSAAARRG